MLVVAAEGLIFSFQMSVLQVAQVAVVEVEYGPVMEMV
jgi:hypothetical protein